MVRSPQARPANRRGRGFPRARKLRPVHLHGEARHKPRLKSWVNKGPQNVRQESAPGSLIGEILPENSGKLSIFVPILLAVLPFRQTRLLDE